MEKLPLKVHPSQKNIGWMQIDVEPSGIWLGDLKEIAPNQWEARRCFLQAKMADPTIHDTQESALSIMYEDWRWYKAEKDFPRPDGHIAD